MACVQLNPMGLSILKNNIKNYIDEYYNKSDIDIMFIEKDLLTYINKVSILISQIDYNITEFNNVFTSKININIRTTICLIVSTEFIKDNIPIDTDHVIKNIHTEYIINMFKPFFTKLLEENMITYENINKIKYSEEFDISNSMYRIKIDNNILKEELKISLKYDISSIYLPHPLEIFSTESEIIDMVSNFHLPCVRLYYNGIKLNLLPSCITAISTGMCLDYKRNQVLKT